MPRVLIGLLIVQTLLIAVIGLRVMALTGKTDVIAETQLDLLAATARAAQGGGDVSPMSALASPTLNADDIRRIIREEMAALPPASGAQTASLPAQETKAPDPSLREEIERDLNVYIASGVIAPHEMTDLQMKIARLPRKDQGEMLSRLVKAMNAGEIDGQL